MAYRLWQKGISREWWSFHLVLAMYLYGALLIASGIVAPLRHSFFTSPLVMAVLVLLKQNLRKRAGLLVLTGLTYPPLPVQGQVIGGQREFMGNEQGAIVAEM